MRLLSAVGRQCHRGLRVTVPAQLGLRRRPVGVRGEHVAGKARCSPGFAGVFPGPARAGPQADSCRTRGRV